MQKSKDEAELRRKALKSVRGKLVSSMITTAALEQELRDKDDKIASLEKDKWMWSSGLISSSVLNEMKRKTAERGRVEDFEKKLAAAVAGHQVALNVLRGSLQSLTVQWENLTETSAIQALEADGLAAECERLRARLSDQSTQLSSFHEQLRSVQLEGGERGEEEIRALRGDSDTRTRAQERLLAQDVLMHSGARPSGRGSSQDEGGSVATAGQAGLPEILGIRMQRTDLSATSHERSRQVK